jgi:N-acetylmuramic acid 6-phosphate etherase
MYVSEMVDSFDDLVTEARAGRDDLDLLPARELVGVMNREDASVAGAVEGALDSIAGAVEAVSNRLRAGGRLIYVGAGTSGRLAAADAAESVPTFNIPPELIQAIVAGGAEAVWSSLERAEDDAEAGRADLASLDVRAADAVVGVSASGRTPYVIAALELARSVGALTVAVSCNSGARTSAFADHPIEVPVGPEVVAGSTRLKAGTAQKMILNMFSTATMIRLGRTYGDLMVDVRSENEKLRARALRVVRLATGADDAEAAQALAASGHNAAVAVVMVKAAVDSSSARRALEAADGSVREAIRRASS